MKKMYFGFLAIFCLLFSLVSNAQWSNNSTVNTPVNVSSPCNQQQMLADGSGGAFIVWVDYRNNNTNLYAQHFNAAGIAQWTTNGVAVASSSSSQTQQQLVSDGSGGIIVVWVDSRNTSSIYAQHLDASGNALWANAGVEIHNTTDAENQPVLAYDDNGGAIIAWTRGQTNHGNNGYVYFYATHINSSQTLVGGIQSFQYNPGVNYQYYGRAIGMLADGSGGAFFTYSQNDGPLVLNHISSTGTLWNSPTQLYSGSANATANCIISDGAGGTIICWSPGNGVYAQHCDASGTIQWNTNGVNLVPSNYQATSPQITTDGAGGAILTWMDYRSNSNWAIYSQRINSSGSSQWTSNGVAVCNTPFQQLNPQIVSDGNNGAIITWQSNRFGAHIYARKINSSGSLQWTPTGNGDGVGICTYAVGNPNQGNPKIVTNGSNGAIISFTDYRLSQYYSNLYAQSVNADGTLGTPSNNANLSALTTTAGTLNPSFDLATTAYTASVANGTNTITFTPTKSDDNASIQIRINGGSYTTVTSGNASAALSLNIGSNTIDVTVTAQDGSTKTYTITVTRACAPSTSTSSATACDSLVWNGTTYTTSGTYTWSGTNAAGCDSTATLNLTVNNPSSSTTTTTACDSLVWNGTTYTTSGTYTWSGTNAAGCDSTATLNLTVNHATTSIATVTVCDSLIWNGTKYTSSGVYTYSTTNAAGCDSTATLNLTVNYSSSSSLTVTVCDSLIWNGTTYRTSGTYTYQTANAVGCDSTAILILTVNNKPTVDSIVGLTNIEILAIGGGGGAGGPDGPVGAGGGAGGAVYGKYTLPANGSNIYTVGVGGGGGYGQGCAGNAPGGTAGVNGGGIGGNAGTGGCSGGGGGGGGWSGFYQGSTYYVVAGGGAGGGGSNEGTANDIATPGGGNQSIANGTSMTGQNGTAYSGDGGGGGAGGGGFYGGAGQSSLNQTNLTTSQAWGGANYTNPNNRTAYATYVGNSGALSGAGGTGGQGTTSTITNSTNFNYNNTYGKGGNAQGNGGTSTTANGNNGVVIIRYQGSPVATGGTITQSDGYTLHTFTTAGSNTFRANSATAVCVGSTTSLSCATPNGVWSSSDTTIATIDASTGMVTGITPGVVTITYTVTSAQGCVGKSTKQFTVNPLPVVPAITGNTTICDNTTTTLSNTLTGGVWSSSLPSKASVNASTGLVTGVAAGTSTITYLYTDNNGCSNTNSTVVTINASPTVAAITGNAGVCIGSTTTFSNVTLNGTWSSSNTNVATINSSGLISTVATGNSVISYTVINASTCTTVVTKSITVNALPNVTANATATTVCYGTSVTLTGGNASSYTWNNSVTNGVAFAPTATNSYTVTGTDGNGCVKTANITINVNPLPIVSISPSVTTLCNGYSSTLTASGASTYGWTIVGGTPYLDQVSSTSTLKLAAGLHKLKSSYSGAAIRIRRSSDNAEQDFGFSGNDLDVAAISTFIGAGTAYVKTLYDQSGNGNHLSQTSTGNQPTLTLSGLNSKPVIHTNTSQNIYTTTNFPAPFSVVYAARQTGGTRGRLLAGVNNNWLLGWWGGNRGTAYFEGWITASNTADNNFYVYSGTGTGSGSSFAYQNKVSITTNSAGGNAGPNGLAFNRNEASDAEFTDVVEFNSVLSTADRNIVENGIGAYYGLSGFYNTTGSVATVYPGTTTNYTVYGTDGNGCIGSAVQTINVNPKPNAGADITNACGGSTQTLTGTANTGTWTALGTNPSGATLSSTTSGVATVSFVNSANGTYSFIYTLPTTDCSDTMNIVVGAKPDAGSDVNSVCGGNIISLTGAPTTGTWSAMGNNPASSASVPFSASNTNLKLWIDATQFSTSNGNSLSGVITDASSYARSLTTNATYETTGFNGKPCVRYNNNQTATSTAFNTDQNTYVYTTIELVGAGSSWASVFYHWNRDNGLTIEQNGTAASNVYHWQTGNDNSGCNQTISFGTKYIMAATITSGSVRNFTLYQDNNGTLQNLGTVSSNSYSVPVQLGNLFLGKSDAGEYTNMRMGEFIYFQGSLPVSETSIINYLYSKWFSGGTGGGFTQTSGVATVTYPNAATGAYNYVYTTPFGCTDTTSVFITPKPNAGNDINYLCGGATQVLNGTTTNGTWTAMSTNPTGATLGLTINGSASVTFDNLASGIYNFIYTLPTNCSDTMSITVRPKPNAGDDQAVCILNVATGVTLTSNVTGVWTAKSGNAGTSNIVSPSNISTQVNNFSVVGDYNYINTNNGCTDTVKVTVTPAGSIGNYVWKDQNNDGLQNEPAANGVNGITVELYKKDGTGAFNYYATTTTANNVSGNPGYYNFGICEDGVYKIKVPTVNPFTQTHLTAQDGTANTDGNSDVNPADGFSPEITIDTHGSGVAKDNNTIDVGYQICTKPIAGSDFTSCGGQLVAITGVSTTPALPTTDGNWSALVSNPSGATLGSTILGVATVQFDSLASGVYSFIYTVTGGCDDTLNITVGAKPSAGSDLYEVCGGSILTVNGAPAGGTWSQASANAVGAHVGSTNNGAAIVNFDNLVSGTYTFIYTTPFGCTDTMTISTKPKPNAGSDVYMECGNPRLFDTLSATPAGGTWTALSSNNNLVTLGTTTVSGKARINLPVAPNQGSWSFIYTAPNGCTDTMTYVIGVTGTPAPAINSGSSPICGNSTVQICPTQYGWSNYQWYKNGVAVSGMAGTQACITVDTSKIGSYTLAGTNGSACWSKQSPAVVVSLAGAVTPTITVQGGNTTACNNGSITLISSSLNNNQWNKDGVAISGATGQYYNATTSGVYTVTATNCGYTRTSAGTTITIVPYINVSSIQASSGSVCTGSTLALTNSTTGGVWTSSNPSKATVNAATGLVSGIAVGSTTITYTVTLNGCSNSVNYYLNVVDGSNIATPTIVAQGATTICGSNTVQLCTGTFGWSNYQWYKNGVAVTNATGTCITVDTSKLGSYTLAAATGSGCWSMQSAAQIVGLSSLPSIPSITPSGSTTVCNNGTLSLTSSAASNNQWYKDGVIISGATSQIYTASTSGDYTVRVTNCAGTTTSAATTVTIIPTITLSSIQSSTSSVCKAATTVLSNSTSGGVWTSSNTSKATVNTTTGVVTGVDTGSVTITYTVSVSGCTKSVSTTLTVVDGSNIVAPAIVAQSSSSICSNGSVTICPTTFGWSNYQWYKNGVAVALNGTSSCITADTSKLGSYTLTATYGSGCWSPQSNAVVVNTATAPVTPTISGAASTCNGQTVQLTSNSVTNNQWYKDGTLISGATNQVYTANASGTYTVAVTNACGGSATSAAASVSIGAYITVNSIQSVTGIVCKNATQTLVNTTPNGVWSSNNTLVATVNSVTGLMTGIDTGTVTITYTVTVGGCSNFAAATFTVVDGSNIVPPTIVAQSSASICSNGSVTLCPTTFGWSNYNWYKNGILVSQNGAGACITVDTSKLGTYTLSGTTGTGCWSSQSNAITVSLATAPAAPSISTSGATSICNGSSVTLTSSAVTNNQWYKDGVAISGATSQTYTATVSGVYKVASIYNCGSTLSTGVTVTVAAPVSVASISSNTGATVCSGNNISLSCSTVGGVWSSNNTAVATVNASGLVSTLATGTAVISYTITSGSCTGTSTYTVTVQSGTVTTPVIAATGGATSGSTAICGSGTLQLCPQAWGYSNYQWYKNGVAYSTSACINVNTAGSYTLAGTNGSGCWSAQSAAANVTINAIPTVTATSGSSAVCVGSSIALTNSSTIPNGGTGVWSSMNIRASINNSGILTGTSAGTAQIRYTVTSSVGCSSFVDYYVNVNALPSVPSISYASGTVNPQIGAPIGSYCTNKTFTVVGTPSGGVWSTTGLISVTNPGGVVTTGNTAGAGTLSYTYTDFNSCSSSRTISGNVVTCAPRGVSVTNDFSNNDFVLYPNPAKNSVNINIDAFVGSGTIIVADLFGKTIISQPLSLGTNKLNIPTLSKGVYLVGIITNEGKNTKKLVVD